MDKNYNVDDILEEIKRRKSSQRSGTKVEPKRAQQELSTPVSDDVGKGRSVDTSQVGEGFAFNITEDNSKVVEFPKKEIDLAASFEEEFSTASFEPPIKETPPPKKASSTHRESDGFEFKIPPIQKVTKSNPLQFDGHIQPITDKARLRQNRFLRKNDTPSPDYLEEERDERPKFSIERDEQELEPPIKPKSIDFSRFKPVFDDRPPDKATLQGGDKSPHRTRILPKLGVSQELNLEDIRKIDFGAVVDDANYQHDEDYQHEELDGYAAAPANSVIDYSEYNSTADKSAVARDIARVKFWLVIRATFTFVLTACLFYLVLCGKYKLPLPPAIWPETNMRLYMVSIVVFGVLVAVINSSAVGGGIISLFKMRANSDTLASVALLAGIGQAVGNALKPENAKPEELCMYIAIGAVAMLFNALGKMTMINRIQANFAIIASDSTPKRAVLAVESDEFCKVFIHEGGRHRPTIAYSAKAGFFTDFLGLSYSDKYDVGINRAVAPICILGAAMVAVVSYIFAKDLSVAVTAFVAILSIAATLSASFVENIPLGKLTKKLAPLGGMVSGNKAVENFCDTQAIVLREIDLFPQGAVTLHGIKAYSQGRIDEAILDAASVICASECALSPVFMDMIGHDKKLLKKVDNLVVEDGMGISAWVNSRRVLIGNRAIMQNHGVLIPTEGYEQQYIAENGEAIYLSNSGELAAQFVVSYHIDMQLAIELDHMAAARKNLILHAVDPNLTPKKIWSLYSYPEELVHIIPTAMQATFKEMSAPREVAAAEIAYLGDKAAVMVHAIRACMSARSSILAATVITLVQIILGYGLVTFLAFIGTVSSITVLQVLLYQSFWFAIIFIVQKIRPS